MPCADLWQQGQWEVLPSDSPRTLQSASVGWGTEAAVRLWVQTLWHLC